MQIESNVSGPLGSLVDPPHVDLTQQELYTD